MTVVGRVHQHVEYKIVDEEGRVAPRDANGEVCTRRHLVMLGYGSETSNTAHAIDAGR